MIQNRKKLMPKIIKRKKRKHKRRAPNAIFSGNARKKSGNMEIYFN